MNHGNCNKKEDHMIIFTNRHVLSNTCDGYFLPREKYKELHDFNHDNATKNFGGMVEF